MTRGEYHCTDLFLLFCKSELFAKLFAYIIHHTFMNYEFWVLLSLLLYISSTKKSKTLCAQGWHVHLFSPRMQSWYLLMFCKIMATSNLIQIKKPTKNDKVASPTHRHVRLLLSAANPHFPKHPNTEWLSNKESAQAPALTCLLCSTFTQHKAVKLKLLYLQITGACDTPHEKGDREISRKKELFNQ